MYAPNGAYLDTMDQLDQYNHRQFQVIYTPPKTPAGIDLPAKKVGQGQDPIAM